MDMDDIFKKVPLLDPVLEGEKIVKEEPKVELTSGDDSTYIAAEEDTTIIKQVEEDRSALSSILEGLSPNIQEEIEEKVIEDRLETDKIYERLITDERKLMADYAVVADESLAMDMLADINAQISDDAIDIEDGLDDVVRESHLLNTGKVLENSLFGKSEVKDLETGKTKKLNRRGETMDATLLKNYIRNIKRLLSPATIEKTQLIESRKQYIEKVLLDERTYALYRHKFIEEKYKNIIARLPKVIVNEYGEGYLREAFMIVHVIYKYVPNSETLDPITLAEIIIKRSKYLPLDPMSLENEDEYGNIKNNGIELPDVGFYDRPFTLEFFSTLAKENVFKSILKMVKDDILVNQLSDLTAFITSSLDFMKTKVLTGEEVDTKELKVLTELLDKVQTISSSLVKETEAVTLSYVYSDSPKGLDYSELVEIEKVEPKQVPMDFTYYIICFDLRNEEPVFAGYIVYDEVRKQYVSSKEGIKLWPVKFKDTQAFSEFSRVLDTVRKSGQHAEYKVGKLINNNFMFEEREQMNG